MIPQSVGPTVRWTTGHIYPLIPMLWRIDSKRKKKTNRKIFHAAWESVGDESDDKVKGDTRRGRDIEGERLRVMSSENT